MVVGVLFYIAIEDADWCCSARNGEVARDLRARNRRTLMLDRDLFRVVAMSFRGRFSW